MSRYSFAARVVCSLAFGCLAATPASAQREAGPFAGLFDRDRGDKRGQTLDVHASLFGMYDDDKISAQEPATIDDRGLLGSGAVGSIEASIGYKRRAKRARFHLSGGGLFQKYPAAHFFGAMYSATAGVDVNLTRKLVLDAKGGFSSTPFYQFAPFLSAGAVDASLLTAGNQFADLVLRNETLDGALTLTSNYSKRSSVSAEVSWNETRFLDSPDNNFRIFVSHAAFRHQITRPLAVHLGYGLEQARMLAFGIQVG